MGNYVIKQYLFLSYSTEVFRTVIYHATVCYLAQVDMAEAVQNHINILQMISSRQQN